MIQIKDGVTVEANCAEQTRRSFSAQCEIAHMAVELLARARAAGVTLNIAQAHQQPLAMGNHVDVVTVYGARARAGQGGAA